MEIGGISKAGTKLIFQPAVLQPKKYSVKVKDTHYYFIGVLKQIALKNPAVDDVHPSLGTANAQPKLNVGRKINIPGPDFFSLWPGQMVRVIKGHRLRSNQYLIVWVYEEGQAKKKSAYRD